MIRAELKAWYKEHHREFPEEQLTRISDITVKMIGTANKPRLKTKGLETWGFLLFIIKLLHKHSPHMDGNIFRPLVEAGEMLVQHTRIMQNHGWNIPPAQRQAMLNSLQRHVTLMRPFMHMVPKHHIWCHFIQRCGVQGNPWKMANFLNESLNKNLKACCKNASQLTFESTVLWKTANAVPVALGRKRKYDLD